MADEELPQTRAPDEHSEEEEEECEDEDEDEDDEEEEQLQLKEMADRILHYRTSLPDLIKQTLGSFLVAQRPILPSASQITRVPNPDAGETAESSEGALLAEEDPRTAEKIRLLKLKVSSNVAAMPVILKRVNDCIAMINKCDTYKGTIHPIFKRKRTR